MKINKRLRLYCFQKSVIYTIELKLQMMNGLGVELNQNIRGKKMNSLKETQAKILEPQPFSLFRTRLGFKPRWNVNSNYKKAKYIEELDSLRK